jgi:hypothetical protein
MTKKLTIAIAGTRGIPNKYGGFEQCAQYLSTALAARGYEVIVYNSSEHSFKGNTYQGVRVESVWCPESKIGAAAHFIYDWLCLRRSVSQNHDFVLNLGYQSSAPAIWFFNGKGTKIVTNMDGLEWTRSKWGKFTSYITRLSERVAVKYSDGIISDNVGIEDYFNENYGKESDMIPYGAEVVDSGKFQPYSFDLKPFEFHLIIARLEPENSIEVILDGYVDSKSTLPFIVVGSTNHKYARMLIGRYKDTPIQFVNAIFDKSVLDNLRKYALVYWHGHTVGGTNPSLLEAMAASAFIVSSDNKFNNSVLKTNSIRFTDKSSVSIIVDDLDRHTSKRDFFIIENMTEIQSNYSWNKIANMYEAVIIRYCK